MKMTRKTIVMLLVALGLVVAATSAALGLYPDQWFNKDPSAASAPGPAAAPAPAQAARPSDSPAPPPATGSLSY
jgi:hypothetical protein